MPEPTSKSVDLLSPITAEDLLESHATYLAAIGETDPDDFNRLVEIGELRDWLNTQIAPLLANGTRAGTAMQELLGVNLTDPTELTIASGAVTATQSLHLIDTESDAASDDLDTITAAKGVGDLLILVPANDARTVVLKHGTGNIATFNGGDVSLDTDDHWALLVRVGTRWLVLNNVATGAATDHGTLSGLGDDDHTQYVLANGTRAITGVQELLGINLTDATELTIASGEVTATQSQHFIDTESDAASDDLDTITMASGAGSLLFIAPAHTDRTVVLKHGTGNIATFNGADVSLTTSAHWAILMRFGTTWLVMANSAGGSTDHGTLSGLGDDDHTQYVLANGTRAITGVQELLGINLTDAAELTIASGAVTATQSLHLIDTESDAASDDLDTVTPATGAGDLLVIFPAHTDRTVVLKHGTGNLATASGADITLDSTAKGAMLWRVGSSWFVFANVVPAAFDPASPGAIGGTTAAAGSFTDLDCGTLTTDRGDEYAAVQFRGSIRGIGYSTFSEKMLFYPNISGVVTVGIDGNGFFVPSGAYMTFYSGGWGTSADVFISRGGAASKLQLGANDPAPAAQTFKGPDATGSNNQGGKLTIAGGAGHGTGAQGDVELEGDEIILDAATFINCEAPVMLGQFLTSTAPNASFYPGATIVVTDAGDDSAAGGTRWDYESATSDGSYWRYHSDGAFMGGA